MFIELTLTDGRGYVLLDPKQITAVCQVNGVTEVYVVGSESVCFMVNENAREIIKKSKKI